MGTSVCRDQGRADAISNSAEQLFRTSERSPSLGSRNCSRVKRDARRLDSMSGEERCLRSRHRVGTDRGVRGRDMEMRTPRLLSYASAVVAVGLVMLIKQGTDTLFGEGPPLILFLGAVMVIARFSGTGPGLVVTVLSAIVCTYFYFAPLGVLRINSLDDRFRLAVFMLEGVTVCGLMGSFRNAKNRAEQSMRQAQSQEKVLRESEKQFRLVVESVTDYAIIVLGPDGRIARWNAGAERIKGYRAEEIIGKHFSCFYPEEDVRDGKPDRELKLAIAEGRMEDEGWRVKKDGSRFWANVILTAPVRRLPDGCLASPKSRATSPNASTAEQEKQITVQQLESALAQSLAATRVKSEFLANMSHEIRTPLCAILGFADILRQGVDREAERRDYMETIHSSGRHLLTLIDDILDLSKIEAGRMEMAIVPCSPHSVFADVLSVLRVRAAEKGLSLECRWESEVPESIQTDPARLRQLLMNLVGNAIKFTEHGSVLVVATVAVDQQEPRMVIEVRDTGIGIDPENLERIFLPFDQADGSITRRFGGTGLGLTICRYIARSLGGDLTVTSHLGHGSVFRATLATGPLEEACMWKQPQCEALRSANPARATTAQLNGTRLLLVEDGETNRKLIRLVLHRAGAEIVCVEDGQAGVDVAAEESFDVILMDMQMPVMDGYRATGKIRAERLQGPNPGTDSTRDAGRRREVPRGGLLGLSDQADRCRHSDRSRPGRPG